MDHAHIASAYDDIAERWLADVFNRDNGMRQHELALRFLPAGTPAWALNVGCGCNTRLNAPMRNHGLRIEGVDISARMIAHAGKADPDVVLHHADICSWQAPRAYRFISAWDSIWHVRLDAQRALMLKLMRMLEPGGIFIFSAGGLDAEHAHVDASMGPELCYATLGIPGLLDVIREAGCICRHLEFDQLPHKHLFIIVERLA